jgi:hypothetical protein
VADPRAIVKGGDAIILLMHRKKPSASLSRQLQVSPQVGLRSGFGLRYGRLRRSGVRRWRPEKIHETGDRSCGRNRFVQDGFCRPVPFRLSGGTLQPDGAACPGACPGNVQRSLLAERDFRASAGTASAAMADCFQNRTCPDAHSGQTATKGKRAGRDQVLARILPRVYTDPACVGRALGYCDLSSGIIDHRVTGGCALFIADIDAPGAAVIGQPTGIARAFARQRGEPVPPKAFAIGLLGTSQDQFRWMREEDHTAWSWSLTQPGSGLWLSRLGSQAQSCRSKSHSWDLSLDFCNETSA